MAKHSTLQKRKLQRRIGFNIFTLIIFLISFFNKNSFAQQQAQYSQYMFNGLVLNPAYTGNKEVLNLNAIYRKQWVGITGSPETQTISIDGLTNGKKMGLGGYILNDKLGAQGSLSAFASYSYRLKVNDESQLAFGLAAGVTQYSLDGNKITTEQSEQGLAVTGYRSVITPDVNTGAYLSSDKYYVGFSVSSLVASQRKFSSEDEMLMPNQNMHYYLTAGKIFDLSNMIKFYPSFLLNEDFKKFTNIDVSTFFLYDKKIWFGGTYRTAIPIFNTDKTNKANYGNAVVFITQYYVNPKIRIGYAFDYSITELNKYNNGTHEFSLGYYLFPKKNYKALSPRYF
ncbi:MAG: type IX secretion system membrane protein PorP/SprF [Daejeonella sp.]